MLGHMVVKYLNHVSIQYQILESRWPSDDFKKYICESSCDYLINCIAKLPQKKSSWADYKSINIELPIFISKNFKGRIIHPTSDCEFSGNVKFGKLYNKCDVKDSTDDYGITKIYTSYFLSNNINVKQIRCSIIGPEINDNKSLMSWFFSCDREVHGYSNNYWNGITSLEWIKQSIHIIQNWNTYDNIIQLGTDPISKYTLLCIINKIFDCKKNIISINTNYINRCLKSDYKLQDIERQLIELKKFYDEN